MYTKPLHLITKPKEYLCAHWHLFDTIKVYMDDDEKKRAEEALKKHICMRGGENNGK